MVAPIGLNSLDIRLDQAVSSGQKLYYSATFMLISTEECGSKLVLKYKYDWFGDGSQLAFFCKDTANPLATQRYLVCRDVRVCLYRIGHQFSR
jgi:hypothetical protein